jgi:hypothetical protein
LSEPKIPLTKITLAAIKSKRAEEQVLEVKQPLVQRGRQDAKSSNANRAKERSGEPTRKRADSRRAATAPAPDPRSKSPRHAIASDGPVVASPRPR